MRSITIILLLLSVSSLEIFGAETNTLLVFHAEKRAGAMIFVDECLARGLTNSMAVAELCAWATNTIQRYEQPSKNRYALVPDSDIPDARQPISIRNLLPRDQIRNAGICRFGFAPRPQLDSQRTFVARLKLHSPQRFTLQRLAISSRTSTASMPAERMACIPNSVSS
jgi:hypothetical protein